MEGPVNKYKWIKMMKHKFPLRKISNIPKGSVKLSEIMKLLQKWDDFKIFWIFLF